MKINHAMVATVITTVTAGVLALSAPANAATTVSIGLQEAGVNGGVLTTVAGPGSSIVNFLGTYGIFDINSVTGSVAPAPDLLDSQAIDQISLSAASAGTLTIFVSEQGLTTPIGTTLFRSGFTVNDLSAGWSVAESTFLSSANLLYGTTTPLSSVTCSAICSGPQFATVSTGAGPYSLTEKYVVTAAAGGGNANATIDISAVPEPSIWAMMLVGFGGIGFMMRGSRRKQAGALKLA